MKLKELHVLEGHAAPQQHRRSVSRVGKGVGGGAVHVTETTRGKEDRLGPKDVQFARGQLQGDHTGRLSSLDQHVEHLEFVVEGDLVLGALL